MLVVGCAVEPLRPFLRPVEAAAGPEGGFECLQPTSSHLQPYHTFLGFVLEKKKAAVLGVSDQTAPTSKGLLTVTQVLWLVTSAMSCTHVRPPDSNEIFRVPVPFQNSSELPCLGDNEEQFC